MKVKLLSIYFIFFSLISFGQDELTPDSYSTDFFITDNQPTAIKEYLYDYDSQVPEYIKKHTFSYNSIGKLLEHVESGKDITDIYQTFRDRFQYDSKSRLTYYWNEQETFSGYSSQNEQQWIFDTHDMITDVNIWSVVNGTKYLGGDSYKRVISRDAGNNVLKIEKSIYTSMDDALVLDKVYTFKYDENNILDSIILYTRNITLGGIMTLQSKQYNFDFKNYDVLNTDLLTYNAYGISNYNDEKTTVANTYDIDGRLIRQIEKYPDNSLINDTEWLYESNKTTITDLFEKDINYIDASGRIWERETYLFDGTDWQLENSAYTQNIRTFKDGKILSDLFKNYYDSETDTYKNDTRFDYEYSPLTTGILQQKRADIVLLYPNPSTGIVYVKDYQKIQKLSVSSISGTAVSLPVQEQLDLSGFASGVYIVTAEYADMGSSIQRLILK